MMARIFNTQFVTALPAAILAAHFLASCAHRGDSALSPGEAQFVEEIKPILEQRCLPCHNGSTFQGGYNLANRSTAFRPAPAGPFIVPGEPDQSKILTVILHAESHGQAMPPTGHGLGEIEILLLEKWIREGASWPQGRHGKLKPDPDAEPRSI